MDNITYGADTELAPPQSGARLVEQVGDVCQTTKVPVVVCHTPTNPLTPVLRLVDYDHLIGGTRCVEHFELTELRTVRCRNIKTTINLTKATSKASNLFLGL